MSSTLRLFGFVICVTIAIACALMLRAMRRGKEGFAVVPGVFEAPGAVLSSLVDGVIGLPDKLHDKSVSMATTIRNKLYSSANKVANVGADQKDPSLIPFYHKDELDALRTRKPKTYKAFVAMAVKGPVLNPEDSALLTSLARSSK